VTRLRFTHQARADLIDIWIHIAADSQAAAERCLDRIEARCRDLMTFPELGPERPDIAPDARMLVIDRWLALYRIEGGDVQIVRVVDGTRDLTHISMPGRPDTVRPGTHP
jgi:toxin ParE1/3/4